jgi:hypothetical protein
MRNHRLWLLFPALLTIVSILAWAQSGTTSLHGTISDANGAVLPGAALTITDPQTGFKRTVQTASDGTYQFLQIQPASYNLEVSAPGFATLRKENVHLQVSTPATVNFTMQVATTRVEVQVTSEAPLVNTQDASIGNAFNTRQLIDLPSEGRDPVSILSLQPGVTYIGSQVDQTNDSRGGSVAGARSDQTNITWDGLDNNDQLSGNAFQGALRSTLDSLQEFRVTTNSGNADEGRSSGAQVSLVTKSGTNALHGSLYEYNRNSVGEANDWFNKQAQLSTGQPNRPPQLIRNTFGATLGGPIVKDRFFFFVAYEGQRTHETIQTTRVVPSALFRQGIIQYQCMNDGSDPSCLTPNPGSPFTIVGQPTDSLLTVQLTPAQFANMDPNCVGNGTCPLGNGVNPLVANLNGSNPQAIFAQYPFPNTLVGGGDLLNLQGFTFPGANPIKHDTYIVRLDYKLTANGNHSLFVRGNLQNDHEDQPPQFPRLANGTTLPPNDILTDNAKGIAVGYTALIRSNLINNFRWALVRQGLGDAGANSRDYVHFRTIDNITGLEHQSTFTNVPVHNFVDDLSWTRGKHTLQFGTNLRFVHNNRAGNDHNVTEDVTDPFTLVPAAISNTGTSLDPSAFVDPTTGTPYPLVSGNFAESYDFAATALAGLVTVVNKAFNQDKTGRVFAPGALISRHFKSWEAEWYAQDSWRVTPNLVLTGGLRYALLQPPYEANGNQASTNISVGQMFAQRAFAMEHGQPFAIPNIQFVLSGQANGKKPYWNWDYKDVAPRIALAYSPHAESGWLHSLFGNAGKSSIRAGYGIYYDHFGQGIVNTFDRNGSFGLTTTEVNPLGIQTPDCSARFTDLFTLPQGTYCGQDFAGVPPGPFPVTAPSGVDVPGGFAIYWGMDDRLKTPYSHVIDFSITRELSHNFSLEISYIGRLGRRLLQETDLAMPENIRDPKSGMDYFTAATMLSKLAYAGTDPSAVAPIAYWENLFPVPAGSTMTATQQIYLAMAGQITAVSPGTPPAYGNEITALQAIDTTCTPLCAELPGQSTPTPYNFFLPQFSSLWGWRSAGNSSYNALNLSLRHVFSQGLQFDINYTYSKAIDVGSNAERINVFDTNGTNVGGFSSQVINAWSPNQLRSVSDYDMTHQINANWIAELPLGRGKRFGGDMGRVANAVLGGWSFSGLFHWTTGLPFSVLVTGWSTNYNLAGEAFKIGDPGTVGVYRDANGNPNMFPNSTNPAGSNYAPNAFRHPYPGEGGQRNELRGPGYFGIDAGLGKEWSITEQQKLKFAWEVFNVTNAVRFDAALSSNNFNLSSSGFGVYSSTLTKPRVMQFSLRYSF